MILDTINAIYIIYRTINSQQEIVCKNKNQCNILHQQINLIIPLVERLHQLENNEQFESALIALENCLQKCSRFIEKFTKNNAKAKFSYFAHAEKHKKEFNNLMKELQDSIKLLSLGLETQQLVTLEKEAASFHKEHLEQHEEHSMLEENMRSYVDLLKARGSIHNEILLERLKSIKHHQISPEQHQLDHSLIIPYYELKLIKSLGSTMTLGEWSQQTVAIKKSNNQNKQKLVTEAKIMSQLRSPFIVQLYGICLESNHYCLIIEYMKNGNLYLALATPNIDLPIFKIALDIAQGICYLHRCGILHKNLTSHAILLDNTFHAKLSYFDRAFITIENIDSLNSSRNNSNATETSENLNDLLEKHSKNIKWLAPECLKKNPKYTTASDIYGLGIIFWELSHPGMRPYATPEYRSYPDPELVKLIVSKDIRPKFKTNPNDSSQISSKLITACWAQDSKKRPNITSVIEYLNLYQPELSSLELEYKEDDKLAPEESTAPNTPDRFTLRTCISLCPIL